MSYMLSLFLAGFITLLLITAAHLAGVDQIHFYWLSACCPAAFLIFRPKIQRYLS